MFQLHSLSITKVQFVIQFLSYTLSKYGFLLDIIFVKWCSTHPLTLDIEFCQFVYYSLPKIKLYLCWISSKCSILSCYNSVQYLSFSCVCAHCHSSINNVCLGLFLPDAPMKLMKHEKWKKYHSFCVIRTWQQIVIS